MYHKFLRIFCGECGYWHDVPIYCGNRFCQTCSHARTARVRHRIKFLVDNSPIVNNQRYKFITLTMRSESDLSGMIKNMLKSFRRLRARKLWKSKISGGCFVIEVKGKPGKWHVHIHAICIGWYIPWEALSADWEKCSGSPGIDVRPLTPNQVVNYVTKYITKPSVGIEQLASVNKALKGTRMFNPFGSWFKLSRKYIRPVHPCPECGDSSWTCWDIIHDKPMTDLLKELKPDGWQIVEGYEPLHDPPRPCFVGKLPQPKLSALVN